MLFRKQFKYDDNIGFEYILYRKSTSSLSIVTVHGAVLALAASVLSVPYDMPGYCLSLCYFFHFIFPHCPSSYLVIYPISFCVWFSFPSHV
jgi:hypothetical protein